MVDGIVDTLRYSVFRWLTYCWYFEIFSISMVDVLLVLEDIQYFDNCTDDNLRYSIFQRLIFLLILRDIYISRVDVLLIEKFNIFMVDVLLIFHIFNILMVDVLLILWDIQYFDGWRIVDTLRYSIFWTLTYCWYLEIFNISMYDVLLILGDIQYFDGWGIVATLRYSIIWWLTCFWYLRYWIFRWLTYCWYFEIFNIVMVDVLLLLWYIEYFDGVFRWLMVLLILWEIENFDGWRIVGTLRNLIFRC